MKRVCPENIDFWRTCFSSSRGADRTCNQSRAINEHLMVRVRCRSASNSGSVSTLARVACWYTSNASFRVVLLPVRDVSILGTLLFSLMVRLTFPSFCTANGLMPGSVLLQCFLSCRGKSIEIAQIDGASLNYASIQCETLSISMPA